MSLFQDFFNAEAINRIAQVQNAHAEQIAALNRQLIDFLNVLEPRLKELETLLIDKQIPYTLPPRSNS
jgi:hypothetical protein